MVDVIHKTTMAFYRSVNTPDYPSGTYLHSPSFDPDEATVLAVTPAWRKIVTSTVSEMSASEKLDNPLPGVDAAVMVCAKDPVHAATTAALPAHTRSGNVLTALADGALAAQDGETLTANQRLLVKDEGSGTHLENGIYIVMAVGDGTHPWKLQRASDLAASSDVCCCVTVRVRAGTVSAGKRYEQMTMGTITLNTTALRFALIENVLQEAFKSTGAVSSGTTILPADDSIPRNDEGDEYLASDPFTPKSAKSKIRVAVVFHLSTDEEDVPVAAAIFKDSDVDGLKVGAHSCPLADEIIQLTFAHEEASGSTAARTYKVRAGVSASECTMTFNGIGESRMYGGKLASSITITEVG